MHLYVNGNLVGSNTSGAFVLTYNPATSAYVFIGGDTPSSGDVGEWLFNGSIDDLRMFNKVITQAEVKSLYYLSQNYLNTATNGVYVGRFKNTLGQDI